MYAPAACLSHARRADGAKNKTSVLKDKKPAEATGKVTSAGFFAYGRGGEAKLRRKFFAKLSFKKAGGQRVSSFFMPSSRPSTVRGNMGKTRAMVS